MNKRFLAAVASAAFFAPALSFACSKPAERPAIPDPETAVTAQMVKANNEVKAYVQAVEAYLGCSGLPRAKQNDELKNLQAFAEDFNVAIRTFKAKNGQ